MSGGGIVVGVGLGAAALGGGAGPALDSQVGLTDYKEFSAAPAMCYRSNVLVLTYDQCQEIAEFVIDQGPDIAEALAKAKDEAALAARGFWAAIVGLGGAGVAGAAVATNKRRS